jgi:serine protease
VGVCAALGLAATPMARVWLAPEVSTPAPLPPMTDSGTGRLVVELRDDATPADVAAVDQESGLKLSFVSAFAATSDKLMEADLGPAGSGQGTTLQDEPRLIDLLHHDPRVVVAEPEVRYTLPNTPFVDPTVAWDAAKQEAEQEADARAAFTDVPTNTWSVEINSPETAVPADTRDVSGTRPNDPRYSEQWNFQMIGAEGAWKRTTGKGVIVAVIDTGVAAGPTKKGPICRDFGGTRFAPGYDFINRDSDAYDDNGHGTHVAGTIAEATNNNEGVAGLAYDATIMPVKVLSGRGSGTSAGVADGIRWAADHGANVINMSLGSSSPSEAIHNACKYARRKGVVIVCAAGNGFGEPVGYPAAYPECIAVSSVGQSGDLAFYSSYGKEVALAAPGGDMQNGTEGGILQNTILPDKRAVGGTDDYYFFQGTSMASPHVAAAAALLEAQGVTDPARVRDLLTKTATAKDDPKKYGAGILNVDAATAKADDQASGSAFSFVVAGMAGLLLLFGLRDERRSGAIRLTAAGALLAGYLAPDALAAHVGADSAWNLLTFSALLPLALFAVTRRKGGWVKAAGAAALGVGLAMVHDLFVGAAPFTAATFGDAPLPWIYLNLGAAAMIASNVTRRALRGGRRAA